MAPSPASLRLSASALVLLLLTGCGGSAVSSDTTSSSDAVSTETSAAPELRGERAVVERVIDGDTVELGRPSGPMPVGSNCRNSGRRPDTSYTPTTLARSAPTKR